MNTRWGQGSTQGIHKQSGEGKEVRKNYKEERRDKKSKGKMISLVLVI